MINRCEEYKLLVQALADSELELNDNDTAELFLHLSGCSSCREDYYSTVKLKNRVRMTGDFKPTDDWLIKLEKRRSSKIVRKIGYFLIFVPYVLLIGLELRELFTDGSEGLLLKASIGAIVSGVFLLLIYTIVSRLKESKTDRYKEIIR